MNLMACWGQTIHSAKSCRQIFLNPHKLIATSAKQTNRGGEAEIRKHLFFRHIDWDKIANKEVQPPFKPRIRDRLDVSNFDKQFTSQNVELSPTDESFMLNMDQSMFDGFSYTSEYFKYPTNDEELYYSSAN